MIEWMTEKSVTNKTSANAVGDALEYTFGMFFLKNTLEKCPAYVLFYRHSTPQNDIPAHPDQEKSSSVLSTCSSSVTDTWNTKRIYYKAHAN